jgi:hypothetical protein
MEEAGIDTDCESHYRTNKKPFVSTRRSLPRNSGKVCGSIAANFIFDRMCQAHQISRSGNVNGGILTGLSVVSANQERFVLAPTELFFKSSI